MWPHSTQTCVDRWADALNEHTFIFWIFARPSTDKNTADYQADDYDHQHCRNYDDDEIQIPFCLHCCGGESRKAGLLSCF